MMQSDLFPSPSSRLFDDATGFVEYLPDCIDTDTAGHWFTQLREAIDWRHERRRMYERDVDVPRLVASFRLDDASLPLPLRDASDVAESRSGVRFNSVGLNFYRDGRDSVAPHNDHLDELEPGTPIVLLSLGDTRQMTIRAKRPPRRVLQLDLAPGSLLIMSYATQLHYDHGIPKVDYPVGPRISLAFRVRRKEGPAGGHYR
ncbi:alpha-ketoglutarate-dependent dioxygenase AlkB family protein [Tahibacter amnicola]|uniref:Alpha-ketoglutarate-dependent dioxygenase AlkB n=1 Tax=Tahibacter amnicola TaxID=2976241 RepID=A0ABY6BEV6_9GAMM|nr:alpha-ketoglutarate-dependent dioxygenase AlkB [Tahibacter amnicola]UXI68571.1 alpha-ketoglutarate-dependent dioxygenase AlkB [Tahibacter amnicola]